MRFVPERALRAETRRRLDPRYRKKVPRNQRDAMEDDGWVLDKELARDLWMRKAKSHDVIFEDQVWAVLALLGFNIMSNGRSVSLPYGKLPNQTKQVDILAADEDTVLVVECKSSNAEQAPTYAFKSEIESIQGYRPGLIAYLRSQFPSHKIRFIFATNNVNVTPDTQDRIEGADITHLDETAVAYYRELASHLGKAAKFQLLGNLFRGKQIEAMDAQVAAIRGKMGGLTYYSFAIEPSRLLKIAYVLHRNNTNSKWMPTYQRIIRKSRLKSVSEFVDQGGYFPNSLVLNIDNGGKRLRFDRAEKQIGTTTLGILHLPKKYRSVYVVDGQHRLYGFANSDRALTELIPVVAFVDLPREEQVDLFMQINENQQAVPKNLQNTLNADLLWTDTDRRKQAKALKLKVAQLLGEEKSSPLRGRIIIGEEPSTDRRCIGLSAVNRGIDRGRFIGEFSASEVKEFGSFFRTSNDDTLGPLVSFLELCAGYLRDRLPHQWNLGRAPGGIVFTNAGIEAVLRLIGDVVDHLRSAGLVDPRVQEPSAVFAQVKPFLASFSDAMDALSAEEISKYKEWLGSGGPTKYWRRFQLAVADRHQEFQPDGLSEWILDQEKQFNSDSWSMVRDIEGFLKQDVRERLEDEYGAEWYKRGVPKKLFQETESRRADKQYEAEPGVEISWWDCLYIINFREIMLQGGTKAWMAMFDATYTLPSDRKSNNWKDRSAWVVKLNDIRNKVSHDGVVSEDEFALLQSIHAHLDLGGSGNND